jgi:choline kinase
MNETVGVAPPVADNVRRKSQTSLHSARTHRRVRNPFKRRSSDSGGSSSEYDPTDSVPHVARSLDKTLAGAEFTRAILVLLQKLNVPHWRSIPEDLAHVINVRRVFGALTNSIYQITLPEGAAAGSKGVIPRAAPKLLLRLYGAHVEALIDRTHELAMLKRLSRHNIGPLLLGTFTNGRFEQWLDSHTLAREEMRDPNLSGSIARRMRELHDGVKLSHSEKHSVPAVWQMISKWLPRAREIILQRRRKDTGRLSDMNLPTLADRKSADLNGWGNNLILGQKWQMFELALGKYKLWMEDQYPPAFLKQNLAFCHNDVVSPAPPLYPGADLRHNTETSSALKIKRS